MNDVSPWKLERDEEEGEMICEFEPSANQRLKEHLTLVTYKRA